MLIIRGGQMQINCTVCHKLADVASISHYLYTHYCQVTQTIWFTNGFIWSTNKDEVTAVERVQNAQRHSLA